MPDAAAPAAAPANGAPRNNQGQFSPKAGATGVSQPGEQSETQPGANGATNGTPPPSGPQSVEDWSLEGELDVYGEKQKVAFKSKAEALRELQVAAALKKRVRDIQEAERRIAERERSAGPQLSPEQREAQFRREVMQRAAYEEMSPEQRQIHAMQRQLEQFQQEKIQREAREKQAQQSAAVQQMRERVVADLEKGLEISGLPRTHAMMSLLAEIQEECSHQGLPPLPPDLLAAEANKRYAERGVEPLKALKGQALLDRLTPDVVREVLSAEWARRGHAAAQQQTSYAPSPSSRGERLPEATDDKVYGEAEAEQMLRQLRNQRR
jgi:hypothetical protein